MNATVIEVRTKRAHGRSLKDFKNLSWAEKKLIACVARGRECVLGAAVPDLPTRANAIRPQLIRFLALGGDENAPVHEKGIQLQGAYIGAAEKGEKPSELDLDGCKLSARVGLLACHFAARIILRHTEGLSIAIVGSVLAEVVGDGLKLSGDLVLRHVQSTGTIRLAGARICGDLSCRGGHFETAEGEALSCDRSEIGGGVFLDENFHSIGEVRLAGAKIDGSLHCQNSRFENDEGTALSCHDAQIGGNVYLNETFRATGEVILSRARIGGVIHCDKGRFESPGRSALTCDDAEIGGDVSLKAFQTSGEVRLLGAKIGGGLACQGGRLENANGNALSCDGAEIRGSIFLDEMFHASGAVRLLGVKIDGNLYCDAGRFENADAIALSCDGAEIGGVYSLKAVHGTGEVRLLGAKIGGDLACQGGRLENANGNALSCDSAEIRGNVFLDKSFHATGEVRLLGVKIYGDLYCDSGQFENANAIALSCEGSEISGNVFLNDMFHATGAVRFLRTKVGGNLYCSGGRFENAYTDAFSCEGAQIGRAFLFRSVGATAGTLSFAHMHVATLADDLCSWPENALNLDGFRYDHIAAGAPLDAKSRIAWLDRQRPQLLAGKSFALQPWTHLAKVLREQGHFREAAEVDIAREDRLRAAGKIADRTALKKWLRAWGKLGPDGRYTSFFSIVARLDDFVAWTLHWLYGRFSGYGHRPMRIVYSALFFWLTLAGVYHLAASNAHFAPTNPATANALKPSCKKQPMQANINWTQCQALLATYPRFSPLAYSLDLILPVARLGQSNTWTPISDGSWFSLSGWTQRLVWFEEVFGWVAALTLGAIAAGLVKRRDG